MSGAVVPAKHLQSSSSLSFSATNPSCGMMRGQHCIPAHIVTWGLLWNLWLPSMAQNISKPNPVWFTSGTAVNGCFQEYLLQNRFPLPQLVFVPTCGFQEFFGGCLPVGCDNMGLKLWTIQLDWCGSSMHFWGRSGRSQIPDPLIYALGRFGIFNFWRVCFQPLSAFMDRLGLLACERLIYGVKLRLRKTSVLIANHMLIYFEFCYGHSSLAPAGNCMRDANTFGNF